MVALQRIMITAVSALCVLGVFSVGVTQAATGAVYDVPASIDATGSVEVSALLQQWFSKLPSGTAAAPVTVRFAANGTYWSDYTLLLGKHGSGGLPLAMWTIPKPRIGVLPHPAYADPNINVANFALDHVRIDLNGATITQRIASENMPGSTSRNPRMRWGNPMIVTAGASDVEIFGGTLQGSHPTGGYNVAKEDWTGIRITGDNQTFDAHHLLVHDMTVKDVWGDFAIISAPKVAVKNVFGVALRYPGGRIVERSTLTDVQIYNNTFRHSGRQGIVLHGGNNVHIHHNEFRSVTRLTFDSEPVPSQGFSGLWIDHNTGGAGGLGYFQVSAGAGAMIDHLHIVDNTLDHGHFRMSISGGGSGGPRDTLEIRNNHALNLDGTTSGFGNVYNRYLITFGAWDGVKVSDNSDFFKLTATGEARFGGVWPSINSTHVEILRNCWLNAIDNQC